MARIIAIINQKGGVGKTTSTFTISHLLKEKEKKVLMVDADPQGNLTLMAGLDPSALDNEEKGLYFALANKEKRPIENIIIKTGGLDIVPTGLELANIEIALASDFDRDHALGDVLGSIKDHYDFILLDCLPALGILALNALTCADDVIIPAKTDNLSLSGIPNLFKTINKIKARRNPGLKVLGVLPTLFNMGHSHDEKALYDLERQAKEANIHIFPPVNRSTNFSKAFDAGKPVFEEYPKTKGLEAYNAVIEKLIY